MRNRYSAGRGGHERARTDGGREGTRPAGLFSQRQRAQIAQTAARLIIEQGITDWSLAKRKAIRALGLPHAVALPSNDDVEHALTEHHALFSGAAHDEQLRLQRCTALQWMHRLEAFAPLLVGGVAAGWATEHSDIRLELTADDPKTVEILLAGAGISYAATAPADDETRPLGSVQLLITTSCDRIRLVILTPSQRRNRPRRGDEPCLSRSDVAALLAATD